MENRKLGLIILIVGIITLTYGVAFFALCMIISKLPVEYPASIGIAMTWGFVYPISTIPVFIIGGVLIFAGREKYRS